MYASSIQSNTDWAQIMLILSGKRTKVRQYIPKEEKRNISYQTDVSHYRGSGIVNTVRSQVYHDGLVYCVEVPSHAIITRRNGRVAVIGQCQNLPGGNDPDSTMPTIPVMECFIARPGKIFLYLDISQAELRTAAHISQEPSLLETFRLGLDYHAAVARDLFNIPYEEAKHNKGIRRTVKALNFGLFYGLTPSGLAKQANIPIHEAERIFKLYFEKFTLVESNLFNPTKQQIMTQGYTISEFGRPWWNDRDLSIVKERERSFRQGINMRIQSTSSEIVSSGLRTFLRRRNAQYTRDQVMLVNTIHDSIILEVDKPLARPVGAMLKDSAEHPEIPFEISVPWVASMSIGYRLSELDLFDFDPETGKLEPSEEQIKQLGQQKVDRLVHQIDRAINQ